MIRRVLIANRGEIALRIIRGCHEAGLEAVAVFSDADRTSPYVRAADRAVHLGPSAPSESYLAIEKLIAAARSAGADAVHPGYGFLAERAVFAEAVQEAGLVFIGPPASAIRAMGDKTEARRRMDAAGVPIVPGREIPAGDPEAARSAAAELGFPVMVKAAAGGGGKGMRVVRAPDDLAGALETAASEAAKAFGDPTVYLEKLIDAPRHIEIQILADDHRTVHLGERECSIQRRHQKLVEEAPSAAVSPELRDRMGRAAVAAALAVEYRGAGTVEFLVDAGGGFYFLEMNTRLQVEHPVTELVYGVDLVREQLRIAAGRPMQVPEGALIPRGWAIECRITSEDPASGFLPGSGTISYLQAPAGPGIRWDAGFSAGDEVSLHYDSLLAKLIAFGGTRDEAIARLERALNELVLVGVPTNQVFHRRLLADPAFRRGEIDIQFLERRPDLLHRPDDPQADRLLAIVAALMEEERRRSRGPVVVAGPNGEPRSGSVPDDRDRWTAAARREGLRGPW